MLPALCLWHMLKPSHSPKRTMIDIRDLPKNTVNDGANAMLQTCVLYKAMKNVDPCIY